MKHGSLVAVNRAAAIGELSARGLMMIRLVEERAHARSRAALSASELAVGLHVLSDLLDSGLALARALSALELIVSPRWRAALPEMREAIREGKSLAQAFEDAPLTVPPVVTGIIRAGERGSGLAAALRAAADLCRERAETQSAIRNALAYPIMLACAGTASV